MEKALIITADDFGLGPGVNHAVVDAFQGGALTSASLMVTTPGFEEAVALAHASPALEIGLHFHLAGGYPVRSALEIPSLVGPGGAFCSRSRLLLRGLSGRLRRSDVARELEAQMDRLSRAGITPSYINGDKHVHVLPVVRDVVLDAAARMGLAVRVPLEERVWVFRGSSLRQWYPAAKRTVVKSSLDTLASGFARRCRSRGVPTNDSFLSPFGVFPTAGFALSDFAAVLKHLRGGLTELMVHPAYPDQATAEFWSGGKAQALDRHREIGSLLDPGFASLVREQGASLTTYTSALGTPRPIDVQSSAGQNVLSREGEA